MIQVRVLTSNDAAVFPDGLELLNRTQGRDLFKPDYLMNAVQSSTERVWGAFHGLRLVAVGISWVSGLTHTSDRVFEKMGFKPVDRIPQFFYKMSLENPFICPGCGEPPCDCDAIMYRLDFL